jgi:hypothetical protein
VRLETSLKGLNVDSTEEGETVAYYTGVLLYTVRLNVKFSLYLIN